VATDSYGDGVAVCGVYEFLRSKLKMRCFTSSSSCRNL